MCHESFDLIQLGFGLFFPFETLVIWSNSKARIETDKSLNSFFFLNLMVLTSYIPGDPLCKC